MFSACENDLDKVKKVTANDTYPTETAKAIEVIYSDSGLVKAKLNAPVMLHYMTDKPYIEFPQGVHLVFYDQLMNEDSRLTSNYAIDYENEKRMEARHDVVVINRKGEKLNTERLIWDENEKKIHTPDFVKITTAEEIIYGDGLEANEDFTKYQITNIKGTIQIKDEERTENP